MDEEHEIRWIGSSYADLLTFPADARREAGFQLGKVQKGLDPDDCKPFNDAGMGVREIRIHEESGAFRVMYLAKFDDAVYVFHCFQKKSQATTRHDKEIAIARFRAVMRDRRERKD